MAGDFWAGPVYPKIRLQGRWLENAGFPPDSRVTVTPVRPGEITLRLWTLNDAPADEANRLQVAAALDAASKTADAALAIRRAAARQEKWEAV